MTDQNNAPQAVLTDEEIMRAAINASDSLNITRIHEISGPSRTIMGDAGLLELGRAIESALLSKLRAPVADERAARSLMPKLQSLLDRMANDPHTGAMFEADGDTIREAMHLCRAVKVNAALASAPVAGEAMPVEHRLRSWEKLKTQIGSAEWSVAESVSYRGFFMLGLEAAIEHYAAPQASEAVRDAALAALQSAQRFIRNGIEFGYVRMPDADTPDPAHRTPDLIDAAIRALSAQPGAQKEQSDAN